MNTINQIQQEIENCEYIQSTNESDYTKEQAMIIAYENIREIIYGREQEDNGFFDEIMDDESEDEETYEKIKEIIAKVKGAGDMKRPLHQTDEKIATLTECEESYAKGYEDGRKAGHEAGYKAAHEAISNIIMRVLKEIKP